VPNLAFAHRRRRTHRRRSAAVVTALLALVAVLASACSSSSGGTDAATTTHASSGAASTTPSSTTPTTPSSSSSASSEYNGPVKKVKVTSLNSDGATYGVGMPIVLFFSPMPTDSREFTKAVKVTVNGQPADGAWYWEQPTAEEKKSHTVEAHYRMQRYWPADSKIHVSTPIGGLSAGRGLVYGGGLTSLDFNIGDAHVSTVDGSSGVLDMHVTSNGREVKTVKVSLGAAATPTYNGVKIVMQKGENIPGSEQLRKDGTVLMSGPGYSDDPVKWSVRITRSGEYVHAAPWNQAIGQRSTSNGCTNLQIADGKWFYNFAQLGDVVTYSNTGGGRMPSWDGFGDWNLPWLTWKQGGLLLNH
jgi:lipoprotein-anchoring transpeptidase ErfK/SrfK